MNVVEYEITSGTPFKSFWMLLPYPILVQVGKFLIVEQSYQAQVEKLYSNQVTIVTTGVLTKLENSWFAVRNTQTLTPPPPFAPMSLDVGEQNKSMDNRTIRKRKKIKGA